MSHKCAYLIMLVCCLALREFALVLNAFINYGDLAYSHLWYRWVIVGMKYFWYIELFKFIILVFGYSALNILIGIKLPTLPVSISY